jgi:hypothetical protein
LALMLDDFIWISRVECFDQLLALLRQPLQLVFGRLAR